tara:strand:- start:5936 stop:7798 length:1863 start_codon:yes stop_codon:yes gene_type:complete
MMEQRVIDELNKEELSPKVRTLFNRARVLVDSSRQAMSEHYRQWDENHETYKGYRVDDKKDLEQIRKGKPTKQIMPMTYAKVHTFKSFLMSVFMQKERFHELLPVGIEDEDIREQTELIMEKDYRRNKWPVVLDQFLTDLGKFDIGVINTSWRRELAWITEEVEEGGTFAFGQKVGAQKVPKSRSLVKNMGNVIENVSPYNFFPDWRVPLKHFQRGEFCADERSYSIVQLKRLELEKEVANVDNVRHLERTRAELRAKTSRLDGVDFNHPENSKNGIVITRVQMDVIPKYVELSDGQPLGQEEHPVRYALWIANDQKLIKFEPMNYLHGEFTYDVAQYENDEHEFINQGLAGMMNKLQTTLDWFFNSRVESVSRTIDNQLIVDPLGVDMSTIVNRSRVIMLKKGAARTGVDRYVKQLQVQDVTARHLDDVQVIKQLTDFVFGINDNMSGQFHRGRRSATEARVVSQGAASRMLTIAKNIWYQALSPQGRKAMTNLRQGMNHEFWRNAVGFKYPDEMFPMFKGTPEILVRNDDFFVFDGTLPSDKAFLAQSLQEILGMVLANPQAIQLFGVSPKLLLEKIYELRGVKGLETFDIRRDPQLMQMLQMQAEQAQQQEQPTPEQ